MALESRIALVIGNSKYVNSPLRNPINDARDVATALKGAGFQVTLRENTGLRAMADAVRAFGDSMRPDGVAVFYYAGHGVQVRDRNYLLPIDADILREEEIPYAALDVNLVLDKMDRARSRVNIVILDACRNNPFIKSFRGLGQGLAQMEAPIGTLIAYATAPGKVALDGDGRNGIYTRHLLANIAAPGLEVELMFKRVREGVARETRGLQTPWESSSLRGDFVFFGSAPASATARRDERFSADVALWDAIKESRSKPDYEVYLQQYPQGLFAALARARVEQFDAETAATRPAPAVAASAALTYFSEPTRNTGSIDFNLGDRFIGPGIVSIGRAARKQVVLPAGDWVVLSAADLESAQTPVNTTGVVFAKFAGDVVSTLINVVANRGTENSLQWPDIDRCETSDPARLHEWKSTSSWQRHCQTISYVPDAGGNLTPLQTAEVRQSLRTMGGSLSGPGILTSMVFWHGSNGYMRIERIDLTASAFGEKEDSPALWKGETAIKAGSRWRYVNALSAWAERYRSTAEIGFRRDHGGAELQPGARVDSAPAALNDFDPRFEATSQ